MRKYSSENFLWATHKFSLRAARLLKFGKTPHHLQCNYSDYRGFLENVFAGQSIFYGYSFLDSLVSKLLKTKRWSINKKGKKKNIPSLYARWMALFQTKPGKYSAICKLLKSASNLRSEIPHSKLSWSWRLQPSFYDYDRTDKFHKRLIAFLKASIQSKQYKIMEVYKEEIERFVDDPDMWTDAWLDILTYNLEIVHPTLSDISR